MNRRPAQKYPTRCSLETCGRIVVSKQGDEAFRYPNYHVMRELSKDLGEVLYFCSSQCLLVQALREASDDD